MKKKLLTSLIIGASLAAAPTLAFASETIDTTTDKPVEIVQEQNDIEDKKETSKESINAESHDALKYAIEEMRIAITRLESEGMTPDNCDYIVKFGETAIERIRPFYDELTSNSEMAEHVSFINDSWSIILNAYNNFTVAGDGTEEDNIMTDGEIQDGSEDDNFQVADSIKALQDAHSEILIALDRLENEGMTPDNYEYILNFAATSVERVRPFHDELLATGDSDVISMVNAVKDGYAKVLTAYDSFTVAGDGTEEDSIMTDGEVQDGSEDDNFQVADSIKALQDAHSEILIALDRLNSEGMTPDNYEYIMQFGSTAIERLRPFFDELVATDDAEVLAMINSINDGYTQILNAYNNFTVASDGTEEDTIMTDGEIQDGSEDDNFLVPPTVEDGSADDNIMTDGEIQDGSEDDNFLVPPTVEDGSADDNIMTDGEIQDGSEDDNFLVPPTVEDGSADDNIMTDGEIQDGSEDDNFLVPPTVEDGSADDNIMTDGEIQDGSEDDNFLVPPTIEDGSADDNIMTDGEIQDGSEDDNFLVPPTVEDGSADDNIMTDGEIKDGSEDDNFLVPPTVEDGSADDNIMTDGEIQDGSEDDNFLVPPTVEDGSADDNIMTDGEIQDGSEDDNFLVPPTVEDGSADDNIMTDGEIQDGSEDDNFLVPPTVEDGTADDNIMVDAEVENTKPSEELPKTGTTSAIGILTGLLATLGLAKFFIKK
ncbi:MAG: hypothetical protein ACRC57_02670 [Sarcina sp.]